MTVRKNEMGISGGVHLRNYKDELFKDPSGPTLSELAITLRRLDRCRGGAGKGNLWE